MLVHRLEKIKDVLFDAVMLGAAEVLAVKSAGLIAASYKDTTELVTAADRASDTAILAAFQSRFPAIDPEIFAIVEQDLYPIDPDVPLPIATRTREHIFASTKRARVD